MDMGRLADTRRGGGGAGGLHASAAAFTPTAPAREVWRAKPNAYVMIDGEFGGPDWEDNATLAWALVVFRKPAYHPTSWTFRDVVLGEKVVRIKPEPGQVMDPCTVEDFWDKNPEALAWVKRETVDVRSAMRQIIEFLSEFSEHYDLRFISKPSVIDIGRFQYCMTRWGGPGRVIPHRNTVCLATQAVTVCRLLDMSPAELDAAFLGPTRDRLGLSQKPNHFPLDDCKLQICDFLSLDALMGRVMVSS